MKKLAVALVSILLIQGVQFFVTAPQARAAACTDSQFTVEAKHNSVFYYDQGSFYGNYVQFTITNKTGATVNDYYASLSSSNTSKLDISTYENPNHTFITGVGDTKTALDSNSSVDLYWYLKTSGAATNSDITLTVTIYNYSNVAVCTVTSTITATDSTIAANANKLTSVVYSALPTPAANGSETVTVTVKGQTGTIGAGPTSNRDVNLSPATDENFDAKRFRLSGTSYRCGSSAPEINKLYIPNACSGNYTATFTYQYLSNVSSGGSAITVVSPIMQIASGSQMKHTSTPSFTIAAIGTNSLQVTTTNATNVDSRTATLNGSIGFGPFSNLYFCYSSSLSSFTASCPDSVTATNDGNGNLTGNVSGLTSGTTYNFEVVGETGTPTTYTRGGVLNFKAQTIATTNSATSVDSTTATLNGAQSGLSLTDIDTATSYFYYSTTDTLTGHMNQSTATQILVTSNAAGNSFTANLTLLTPSTTYWFEVVVADSSTVTYLGGLKSFTTSASGAVNYTITFDPNLGTLASGNATDTATVASGGDALSAKPADPSRSGYTFLGWNTNSGAASALSSPVTANSSFTLYAIWQVVSSGGGGGGGSAPAPVLNPPTITSISAPEVCAVSGQLTIKGTYLGSATVKVDGLSARIVSSTPSELSVVLPSAPVGTKTITVTNSDGSATTTVKYLFSDTPIFVNYSYPETYKNRDFKYTFKADAAAKYAYTGLMPAGLTLNPLTGEITGAPTQEGTFVFTIIASNICESAPLLVYMFVDKEIPAAFTCSVAFNNPRSDVISDIKLANLKNCLSPIPSLSPMYVSPVIFLSGGIPDGLTSDQALTHPRYVPIIGLIESMNLNAQIYYGAFSGSTSSVQLNVYWPDPS